MPHQPEGPSAPQRPPLPSRGGDRPRPGTPPRAPRPDHRPAAGPGTPRPSTSVYGTPGAFDPNGRFGAPDTHAAPPAPPRPAAPFGGGEGPRPPEYRPVPEPERPRRRGRRWIVAGVSLLALAGIAAGVMTYFEIPPFTDKGTEVSFGPTRPDTGTPQGGAKPNAASKVSLPTGPAADFKNSMTLDDGTHVAVTTLDGKKSGFTGKVWVWAPKQYFDPKYKDSGFPVMIALPGGAGYPNNYWMGTDLGLQKSIAQWSEEGKSKPFILAMPVLNPGPDTGGLYWDGSDIPGQPKMGTWLTEDVPDLVRANFRTVKSRDGWAFMGSSTGGFAGLKAVLKHPDKFKAVIASGPDIVPDSRLWVGHDKEKAENNPELLAQQLIAKGGPDVYLALQVGTAEDPKTLANARKFVQTYGKGPIHTTLREIPGGKHNAKTYVPNMGEGPIQFISKVMEGPVSD
ncbi:alpha/beta hydrolase-fold protein [Streptomyces sp. BI20]|uniref:alpha/beta hydrolase n=1 Tax=Streptomyces sp. BI20 TaxID=3403460 RepID=UPI003C75FEE7